MFYADKVEIGCNVTRIDALIIADTSVDTCPGDYNDPVWGGDEDEARTEKMRNWILVVSTPCIYMSCRQGGK